MNNIKLTPQRTLNCARYIYWRTTIKVVVIQQFILERFYHTLIVGCIVTRYKSSQFGEALYLYTYYFLTHSYHGWHPGKHPTLVFIWIRLFNKLLLGNYKLLSSGSTSLKSFNSIRLTSKHLYLLVKKQTV